MLGNPLTKIKQMSSQVKVERNKIFKEILVLLVFIRKLFGPSITTTENTIRTSLSTMVRLASWKLRGQHDKDDSGNDVPQLITTDDIQNGTDNDS